MAPSSHSFSDRFYDYLNCLQEEFERRSIDNKSSPRRFNIYLGNLKGEFELMSLEIESLREERDEYREQVEVQLKKLQDVHLNFVCERCNIGTTSGPPVPPKTMKTLSRIAVQSQPLDMPGTSDTSKDIVLSQETTPTRRSSQHTSLIQKLRSAITPTRPSLSATHAVTKGPTVVLPSPIQQASASNVDPDSGPKERSWSIEFNDKVEKKLDVEIAHTIVLGRSVGCVKFTRDGKYLAAGCKDGAYIYNVEEGTLIRVLRNLNAKEDHIIAVCFSADRKYLATGAWDGAIFIWEINTRYVRNALKGHTRRIMSLDFSPNGRLLVSASEDNTVRLWNMHDGATKFLTDENSTMVDDSCYASAVFSPNGGYVAASHSDGMVRIWDVCTGQLMTRIEAHMHLASCVAFMPDGKGLVSGGLDHKLRYWEVSALDFTRFGARSRTTNASHGKSPEVEEQTLTEREFLVNESEAFVYSLSISPDGRWVASSSYDKNVRIWDSCNGATQYIVNFDNLIWAVDFSPAGRHLASAGEDGSLRIWRYSSVAS